MFNWIPDAAHELVDSYPKFITLVVIVGLIYLVTLKSKMFTYYDRMTELRDKNAAALKSFIHDSMDTVLIKSLHVARGILSSVDEAPCDRACGIIPLSSEYGAYEARLELTLHVYLVDLIYEAIYSNGFHHFNDREMEDYVNNKGELLVEMVKSKMAVWHHHFPHILDAEDVRYDNSEGVQLYKAIIRRYDSIKKQEKIDIADIKKDVYDIKLPWVKRDA